MPGDFIRRLPQFSFETFDAFRNDRPKEEKWELIDGVPMMMPSPTLIHQRISRNCENLLNATLRLARPLWIADMEIGIRVPDNDRYNPEPDVTVIDAQIEIDQVYAERFYFVVEVLSKSNRSDLLAGSDKPIVLAAKIDFYKLHDNCRGVLIARQDRIEADLYLRDRGWVVLTLRDPAERIVIPDIGDIGALAELYRDTPLAGARPG